MITIQDLAAEITLTTTPLNADKVAKAAHKLLSLAQVPGPTDRISDTDADKVRQAAQERATRLDARAKADRDWERGVTPRPPRPRTPRASRGVSRDIQQWINEETGRW